MDNDEKVERNAVSAGEEPEGDPTGSEIEGPTGAGDSVAPFRLLIIDDQHTVRAALRSILASQPDFEVVGEAVDGVEAIAVAERLLPHVILMDLRMPNMGGAEAIGRIKANHPDVRVLVLTSYDSDIDILPAIEAGATGYLLTDAPREELFEAIRAVAQDGPPPVPATTIHPTERTQEEDQLT